MHALSCSIISIRIYIYMYMINIPYIIRYIRFHLWPWLFGYQNQEKVDDFIFLLFRWSTKSLGTSSGFACPNISPIPAGTFDSMMFLFLGYVSVPWKVISSSIFIPTLKMLAFTKHKSTRKMVAHLLQLSFKKTRCLKVKSKLNLKHQNKIPFPTIYICSWEYVSNKSLQLHPGKLPWQWNITILTGDTSTNSCLSSHVSFQGE